MGITKKEVLHVASLARLALTDEEAELYTSQLQKILSHVEKLGEVETIGVEPTSGIALHKAPQREDTTARSLSNEDATGNAPQSIDGCFKVPKILE